MHKGAGARIASRVLSRLGFRLRQARPLVVFQSMGVGGSLQSLEGIEMTDLTIKDSQGNECRAGDVLLYANDPDIAATIVSVERIRRGVVVATLKMDGRVFEMLGRTIRKSRYARRGKGVEDGE